MSHPSVDLNLKDRNGHTPFAAAMAVRDNDAANTILSREPNAAHQVLTDISHVYGYLYIFGPCRLIPKVIVSCTQLYNAMM
jgi:ankyrin repeat protein